MNKQLIILANILFLALLGCSDDERRIEQDGLPLPTPFNFFLNLDLPAAQPLIFENHLYIEEYGLNGIVIVKTEQGYLAYDRTCPVDPEAECAKVNFINLGTSNSYLECQCGEAFYRASDGFPTNSPEPRKLREYYTEFSGSTLYVDSTIL